jgi:uncharacterized protein (TIGR00159 family)
LQNQILQTLGSASKSALIQITQWSHNVLSGMKIQGNYWIILDILITTFIIYWFLSKILESKAVRIFYGILIIFALLLIGHFLNLMTVNWIYQYLGTILAFSILIIFQPEIRLSLDKLGRFGFPGSSKLSQKSMDEILQSLKILHEQKIGAVIAIERKVPVQEYAKSGHTLHADISKELLISIFEPKSPLHDGAVLISNDKIISSGTMFPMPEEKENFGARHRSAKSFSNHTDAVVLVVSGETGSISVCLEGEMESDLKIEEVKKILTHVFKIRDMQ